MHVLMTAGRLYREDDSKKSSFMPDLTGSLRDKLPHFMDIVGYMTAITKTEGEKRTTVRRLYVQPVGRWTAKCRFASLSENYYDNTDIQEIMERTGLQKLQSASIMQE